MIATDCGALAAVDALGLVNFCVVMGVQNDCVPGTDCLTVVGETAAAEIGDGVAAGGTLVAGDVKGLDNVRMGVVPADCQLDTL